MRFPTWKEVESDPKFQSLDPAKQREYFDKWSRTAVGRAKQEGLDADEQFASGFEGWYNQKAQQYGGGEFFGFDAVQAPTPKPTPAPTPQPVAQRRRLPWEKKPKPVGLFEGISNSARNAFASSQQALAVTGGVTPEEAQEISKIEYEKNARQVSPDYKAYQEAEGWDAVNAFINNPVEVTTNIVAEGLAGSLPSLGAGLAAGGVGAAAGSVVPGVGTGAGFIAGQVAGTFAGSLATEYGSKVLEELQNEGMDLTNPQSITEFFSNQKLVDAAKDKALKRGVPVAAFDAVSAGIGGKVGKILGTAFKTKTREATAELAIQAGLGGGGEVVGSLVAGDEIDPKAVFAEVVGELGPGSAEIAIGKAQQVLSDRRKQRQVKQAAETAEKLENSDAPLTADALKTTVAKNIVEQEKQTADKLDEDLAGEVEKVSGMRPIREEEEFVMPPKEEFKASYAKLTPESLAETEASFQEQLQDEDADTRAFAQTALEALAEFKAEQTPVPTAVTTPTPITPSSAAAIEAPVVPAAIVEPVAAQEAQVYESLGDGRFRSTTPPPENAVNVSEFRVSGEKPYWTFRLPQAPTATIPAAEVPTPITPEPIVVTPEAEPAALVEPTPVAPVETETAASLSRVADNTATDEEVVRLARQGLVNIQDGQNVITPRGEEVMQRGGAPLPKLTPEERTAEIAATPAIVEQAPTVKEGLTVPSTAEAPAITPAPVEPVQQVEELVEPVQQVEELVSPPNINDPKYRREDGSIDLERYDADEAAWYASQGQVETVITEERRKLNEERNAIKKEIANLEKQYERESRKRGALPPAIRAESLKKVSDKITAAEVRLEEIEDRISAPVTTPPVTEAVTPAPEIAAATTPAPAAEVAKPTGGIDYYKQLGEQDALDSNRKKKRAVPQNFKLAYEVGWSNARKKLRAEPTPAVSETIAPAAEVAPKEVLDEIKQYPDFFNKIIRDQSLDFSEVARYLGFRGLPKTIEEKIRKAFPRGGTVSRIESAILSEREAATKKSDIESAVKSVLARRGESEEIDRAINRYELEQSRLFSAKQERKGRVGVKWADDALANKVGEAQKRVRAAKNALAKLAQPTPAVSETITPAAEPAGIAVGSKIQLKGNKFNKYVVTEVLPQTDFEVRNNERSYILKNEKTGEVMPRPFTEQDFDKVDGKKFLKMAPVRVEEKVQPVPEAERYTFEEAGIRAIEFFGGVAPEGLLIVNDSVDPDYRMKAGYDPETGQIILNRAFIRRGDSIEDIITHELGHYIFSDPQFQADFQNFLESMPEKTRADIEAIINASYNEETMQSQIEERQVIAFTTLVKASKQSLSAWENLKNTIKRWINRVLGTNIRLSDEGAMAVFNVGYKRFKRGDQIVRAMEEGTLRTAPESMTQMDRDYLAAVERGDMETAQRMVDEAAKKAGYNVGPFYHGTDSDFTIFDKGGRVGIYFTPDKKLAKSYGSKVLKVYAKVTKGAKVNAELTTMESTRRGYDALANILRDYDGIIAYPSDDGNREVLLRDPNQIKSADPVTRDDAGNVIPLSQRFRSTSPDIRRMAPESEAAPSEKVKRKTKIQSIIEATTGVKRPISRITVNEMTVLKEKIKTRARRRREDKRSQREFADELMKDIKEMTMRGKVRPTQLRAITSKALRTQFDNDKSIQNFIEYFGKVIENANYEADLKSARDAQKSASVYKKRKNIPDNQREILDRISKANVGLIDDPLEFATAAKEYMKAFVPATSKEYGVIPDSDMHSYLDEIQEEIDSEQERIQNETIQSAFEKVEKDEKLTRAEMKAYMGEENYTKYLEEQSKERRAKIEKAINAMANQSKENLINYEPTDFTEEQIKIVKALRKADIEGMSPDQKREYIQFVDSIVANNTTYGAAKVAGTVEAIANANRWVKDKAKAAKGRAAFEVLEKVKTGLSTFGRSVPDIFREIFKKGSALGQIQQQMGIYDLTRGQVNANKMVNEIELLYQDFYKENNKKYPESMTQDGLLAEGIVSYLIQREPQTDDAQSVKDRARKLQTIMDRWKENPKTKDYGNAAQAVFDKVMADSSSGILDNLKEQYIGNYKSLVWMRDTLLPKYRPMLKEFDENFQNQSSNYDESNYLPISYIKKFISAERLNETSAAYDNRTFKVTQIASSIKRKKMENIPKDMDLDLNIRRGVFNNLAESISKSQTAPAWNKIISFLDSANADKVFGTEENKQMVLNILTGLKTSRERKAYLFDGADQLVDTLTSGARSVASSLALGGFTQPIKQMPEQLFSTAMNVDPFTLGKNLMPKAQKDAATLLDKFSIGERADVTAGTKFINQAESAYNRAEKYMESSKWLEAKDAISKANRLWMKPLTGSDVYAARAAWMSYYQQYLKREKIPFLGWDKEGQLVDADPQRQAAAAYAESITDIYQGASDPTKMALFAQRGRNAAENLLKAIFFNFNSFSVQQKSRFFSDARDLVSNTTDFEDKVSAARGLTATIGGIILFNLVRAYAISAISNAGVSLVYAMLGVDQDEPDEEEKKKDAEFRWKKFISGTMSNFFMGGGGQFAEEGFIDLLNTASYWVEGNLQTENVLNKDGSVMSYKTYERTNAPFWRYKSASTAPVPLGLFEIPLGQVEKLHDIVVNTLDEDKFENLTEEEKRIISFNSLVQFLYVTRIFGDVDVSRIVEKSVKDVEKQAKEREESQRKLMRMFQ